MNRSSTGTTIGWPWCQVCWTAPARALVDGPCISNQMQGQVTVRCIISTKALGPLLHPAKPTTKPTKPLLHSAMSVWQPCMQSGKLRHRRANPPGLHADSATKPT